VLKILISPVSSSTISYSASCLCASATKTFALVIEVTFNKPSVAVPVVKSTSALSFTA